jgi:hypothetical protein
LLSGAKSLKTLKFRKKALISEKKTAAVIKTSWSVCYKPTSDRPGDHPIGLVDGHPSERLMLPWGGLCVVPPAWIGP